VLGLIKPAAPHFTLRIGPTRLHLSREVSSGSASFFPNPCEFRFYMGHREKLVCSGVTWVVPTRFQWSGSEVGRRAAFPLVTPLASVSASWKRRGQGLYLCIPVRGVQPVIVRPKYRCTCWFDLHPIPYFSLGGGHLEVPNVVPNAGVSVADRGGGRPERQLPRGGGPPGGRLGPLIRGGGTRRGGGWG